MEDISFGIGSGGMMIRTLVLSENITIPVSVLLILSNILCRFAKSILQFESSHISSILWARIDSDVRQIVFVNNSDEEISSRSPSNLILLTLNWSSILNSSVEFFNVRYLNYPFIYTYYNIVLIGSFDCLDSFLFRFYQHQRFTYGKLVVEFNF